MTVLESLATAGAQYRVTSSVPWRLPKDAQMTYSLRSQLRTRMGSSFV